MLPALVLGSVLRSGRQDHNSIGTQEGNKDDGWG